MRAMIRNTTALTSALAIAVSLVSPGFVQAQTVAEACGANRLTLHESDLQAAGLDLPDPFRRALAGEPVDGAIRLVETDGRRALCLTPDDLGRMGADQQQLAMLQDADAKAAAIPGSGAQQATGQAQQAAEEAQDRSQRPVQPGENAQARQEQAAEQAERAQQQAAEDAQQQQQAAEEDRPQQEQASEGGPAQQEQQEQASGDPAQQEPQQQASDDEPAQQPQQEQASDDERAQQQPQQQASDDGPAQQAPQQEQQQASDDDPAQQQEQEQASGAPSDDSELAREMQRIEERAADAVDPVREAERAEAEAPQRSVAAADADEAQGDATVEEETVTEEGSRSSSEEFAEPVNRPANDTADADGARSAGAAPGERDGMSDLEKALLVGLGAVVVGQALGGDAEVVQKTDDRVVVLKDGRYRVIRDDNELIERPGSNVRRETFEDGSTRTTVTRENGVRIVTIRDPGLRVLRRVRIGADGTRTVLIDDMQAVQPVDVTQLPQAAPEVSANDLRAALQAQSSADRSFALYQVRNISQVRKLVPAIPLEAINFRTGSAVIEPEEAQELSALGNLIADRIRQNPDELFLIEGHTDAVGNAAYNLALSDRRAESVALALTEYFDVPPENMVVQGYGEADLKVKTLTAERANRRAAVRRITPLLRQQG